MLDLATETFGDVIVVHAPDELGVDQADDFRTFMVSVNPHFVVLDLDATESIDSVGLTALLEVQDLLRELGGDIKLTTTNSCNQKIFEITRLDRQIEIFNGVIDAVKSFR